MIPAVTRWLAGCAVCLAVLSSTAGAQPIVCEVPSYRFLIKRIGWMVNYGTLGPVNEVALRFSFVSLDKKKGCSGPLTVSLTAVRFEAADRTCALLVPRSAVGGVQRADLFVSATVGGRTLRLHPAVGIPNSVIVLAGSDLEQSTMLALLEKSLADFDAAAVPSAAETVMQTMLPMLQGPIQQIDQDQARRAAFASEQARIAQERWLEAQRRQQEIKHQEALERRRQQIVAHKALLSQLSFLDAQGGIGDRDLLSLSDPSAPGLQGLDDGLRPAGTSFVGLGGDAGSRAGPAEPAPKAPAVGLLDLRRAAFLAEKAQDATPEQAATLVDEALKTADRAAPFVEIDDPGCRHSMVAARSPFACHDMALYQRLTSGR